MKKQRVQVIVEGREAFTTESEHTRVVYNIGGHEVELVQRNNVVDITIGNGHTVRVRCDDIGHELVLTPQASNVVHVRSQKW